MDEFTKLNQNVQNISPGTDETGNFNQYGSVGRRDSIETPLLDSDLRPKEDVIIVNTENKKQNSLVTIFSIWNTMVGTSTLCIPWALNKSGFGCGIFLLVSMALVTLYTAYLIVLSHKELGLSASSDFNDVCRHYFGRAGRLFAFSLSVLSLLSAAIVYWILMSNFLFFAVDFVYEISNNEFKNASNTTFNDVICYPPNITHHSFEDLIKTVLPLFQNSSSPTDKDYIYHTVWNLHTTTPLFLLLVLFPLISFKSPTFFTKFTAMGTISIVYLFFFIAYKAAQWGFHLSFKNPNLDSFISNFEWTFPTLSGTLSLAYFIHNAILIILSHQRNPSNNRRDLSIAYFLVMCTFCFIGLVFFTSFPLIKSCIADNLLNNFVNSDPLAFVARLFLLLQMTSTLPLLLFILKCQLYKFIFDSTFPSTLFTFVTNVSIVTICILFAIFYPQVGNVIRYFGSTCGLGYIFTLPPLIRMIQLKNKNKHKTHVFLFNSFLILIGIANFIAQFFV